MFSFIFVLILFHNNFAILIYVLLLLFILIYCLPQVTEMLYMKSTYWNKMFINIFVGTCIYSRSSSWINPSRRNPTVIIQWAARSLHRNPTHRHGRAVVGCRIYYHILPHVRHLRRCHGQQSCNYSNPNYWPIK